MIIFGTCRSKVQKQKGWQKETDLFFLSPQCSFWAVLFRLKADYWVLPADILSVMSRDLVEICKRNLSSWLHSTHDVNFLSYLHRMLKTSSGKFAANWWLLKLPPFPWSLSSFSCCPVLSQVTSNLFVPKGGVGIALSTRRQLKAEKVCVIQIPSIEGIMATKDNSILQSELLGGLL